MVAYMFNKSESNKIGNEGAHHVTKG